MGDPDLVYGLLVTPAAAWTTPQALAFFALMVSLALLSTARPVSTLAVLFGGPLLALLDAGSGGLGPLSGIGVLTVAVVAEHHVRSTEWAELFQGAFEVQGGLGIAVAWLLFVLGTSPHGLQLDLGPPPRAMATGLPLLLGFAVHAVVYRARARIWRLVRDLGLAGVVGLAESVAAGLFAGIVLLAPYAALGAVAGVVAPMLGVAALLRGVTRFVDHRHRRPCPHCGRAARVEASRCPHCGASIPVARALG